MNAALEAMRRIHRHQIHKVAGISVRLVSAIMEHYGHLRPDRPASKQWELAVATGIAVAFKLLLRGDDLRRCRWDEGFCEIHPTYARFFIDGRKNNVYGGQFLDIAIPADGSNGVYQLCVLAKSVFRSGFVLPAISSLGVIDSSKAMAHADFVRHLRAALEQVGLSRKEARLFAGHSMRAGGATAAATHGLSREDIHHLAGVQDPCWLDYYNRTYLAERLRVSRAIGL